MTLFSTHLVYYTLLALSHKTTHKAIDNYLSCTPYTPTETVVFMCVALALVLGLLRTLERRLEWRRRRGGLLVGLS